MFVPSTTTWLRPITGIRMSPTGLPSAGAIEWGAATGGPVGSLSSAVSCARALRMASLLVSCWSWVRRPDCVRASCTDVPQIWYAVKSSSRTPTPMRTRPRMSATRRNVDIGDRD